MSLIILHYLKLNDHEKIIILIAVVFVSFGTANSQTVKVKYQGDVQLGYSFGIGTIPADRINLHFINGVRINQYFSTGLGLGLDYYGADNFEWDTPELMLPIFLNAKGYLPVANTTDLFLSLDLGTSIGITEGVTGMSGLLLTPSVGAKFNRFNVSLGYNYQSWSAAGVFSINTDALQLKVGITF